MALVQCRRCGQARDGLDGPPFNDDLGRLLQGCACAVCWAEWQANQIKLINEHRLSLGSPRGQELLTRELKGFFRIE
jgi:Fe-S cluster biosynthesis and repair protein YggX